MADTWYAVIDGSGTLISVGTVVADSATLTANGYSAVALAGDPTGQIWDKTSKTFGAAPQAPVIITTWKFIQRFTASEYANIEASSDAQVRQFLTMLMTSQNIVLTDPVVQGGIQYLVSVALITSDRGTAIGAL